MRPPVSARLAYREPTVCDACGAVYVRKTWRRSRRRRLRALLEEADWARCPACQQVREGRFYGRASYSWSERDGRLTATLARD